MPFLLVDPAGAPVASIGDQGPVVLGRGADCGVVLNDPTISRRHAELVSAGDHLLVHDLGSRNGTFRNGVRVHTARLRAGDFLTLGVVQLRVDAEAQEEETTIGASGSGRPRRSGLAGGGGAADGWVGERGRGTPPRPSPPFRPEDDARFAPPPAAAPAAGPVGATSGAFPPTRPPAAAAPDALTGGARMPAPPSAPYAPVVPPPPAARGAAAVPPALSAAETADAEPAIVAEREALSPHELTARRLTLLLEAAKALGGVTDQQAVLDRIVTAALRTLDADRGAIVLGGPDDPLPPVVARDRWGADLTLASASRPVPRSIARAALARRAALLSVDAAADPRFGSQSVLRQRVRSAICAPLFASDGSPLGALYVDSADPQRAFGEADLDFLTAFAGLAAASLENVRLAERVRRAAVARENFARYFAPPVAERIAASEAPARPGGERRTCAVLFADLRGFTRYAAGQSPDEVAATLSEFLSAMVECVFRHGGTLDKFIGDAVMAQWGAPEPSPDDADRALAAALEMGGALAALNARRTAEGRPGLAMGIGLSYGDVFAGNIGSERRLEFTVIGDAVNQASKLCDAAAPGEIRLTDALRAALRRSAPPLRPVEAAPGGSGAAWVIAPGAEAAPAAEPAPPPAPAPPLAPVPAPISPPPALVTGAAPAFSPPTSAGPGSAHETGLTPIAMRPSAPPPDDLPPPEESTGLVPLSLDEVPQLQDTFDGRVMSPVRELRERQAREARGEPGAASGPAGGSAAGESPAGGPAASDVAPDGTA